MWIQPNADIGLLSDHRRNPRRMAITGIGQNQLSGFKNEMSEPLRRSLTMVRSQFKTVAFQAGETKAVMNPPLAPGRARLTDHSRVQHPHRPPAKRWLQSHSALLPQLPAQVPQPEFGIAQPVQQRHIGDIGNAR